MKLTQVPQTAAGFLIDLTTASVCLIFIGAVYVYAACGVWVKGNDRP
jgi:hypothetical protein